MKKIGLVGGLGPEATIDYYTELINSFKDGSGDLNYPEMVIYSMNLSRLLKFMREKEYDGAIDYVLEAINSVHQGGADFAAITANTPHMFFHRIQERSPLPLISIVESACNESLARGYKRPALFGTGFTMRADFYQDVFTSHGMSIVVPTPEDIDQMDHKLFTEIELGIFRDETRQYLISVIERMRRDMNIDSVILGCTEFPLILPEPEYSGVPMLNTTRVHVRAIVEFAKVPQSTEA